MPILSVAVTCDAYSVMNNNVRLEIRCLLKSSSASKSVGLPALVCVSRESSKSSGAKVCKLVSQIKVSSNVVSDTARRVDSHRVGR
jgi:hypothetical protein